VVQHWWVDKPRLQGRFQEEFKLMLANHLYLNRTDNYQPYPPLP
jgi:hypothetical protein